MDLRLGSDVQDGDAFILIRPMGGKALMAFLFFFW